ncbi:MAG: glycosyltransferase family 39 protein [Kiritimatiellae bacterium]|nr:glycosyltransferase family 39 protein [Kiritimatiellia bacterium]
MTSAAKNRLSFLTPLLLLVAAALCLAGIVDHDLWTADEPRVCCLSKTMWETGEWAVPRLAGDIFIEKPPLYFWVCGACGRFFGPLFGYVGGARLSVSLCALGTLAAAAWMAWLLRGRRRDALGAVLVLATMPQFLIDMHWMRTDVLLAFCVAAAAAFLVLAYRRGRPWALLPAGVAAAGAFLAKGPIGWILIAAAAAPLVLQAVLTERGRSARTNWILSHLLAALLAIGLAGLWVLAIYLRDDPSAWNAWFWDNQVGRTTGAATALGHHHPWSVHYYLVLLPIVLGPWLPHLVLALGRGWAAVRRRGRDGWRAVVTSPGFFLVAWGFGGLALLTLPSTKRGIYLLPLYPAYALLAASALPHAMHRFFRVWTAVWETLAAIAGAVLLLLPAVARLLPPDWAIADAGGPLVHWTAYHTATLLSAGLWLWLRRRAATAENAPAVRLFLANAFLWLAVFAVPFQAIDAHKSMREGTLRIAAALPADTSRTGGYHLDETARAALQFYAGVVIRPLDIPCDANLAPIKELAEPIIARILEGRDGDFTTVLAAARRDRDKIWPPSAEAAAATLSGRRRLFFLAPTPSAIRGGARNAVAVPGQGSAD